MIVTVARRTFRSSPHRDALETWSAITGLLTARNDQAWNEFNDVSGIAGSVIADKAAEKAPIVVTCKGPQTRIYCLYDDDAIDGSDSNEDSFGYDPLEGEWSVSLPCQAEDLEWVQAALSKKSTRFTARDMATSPKAEGSDRSEASALVLDVEGFMKS